jgi:ABC-type glycerol-3-phosphate transport system substrate-binding protein
MKNLFKFGFLALALSLGVAACNSEKKEAAADSVAVDSTVVDTTVKVDSTVVTDSVAKADTTAKN